jgi:hypothetical protein
VEFKTFQELKNEVFKDLNLEGNLFVTESEFYNIANRAIDFCEAEIHKFRCEDTYFEACAPLALTAGYQDYSLPSNIYANKIKRIVCQKSDLTYEVRRKKKLSRYVQAALDERYATSNIYEYFIINNNPTVGPRIRMFPRPQETTTQVSTTGTWTSGTPTITVASATGIAIGQYVSGTGIPANSRVVSVVGTTVTIDSNTTAAGSATALSFIEDDYLIYYIRNANKVSASTDKIDIPEFYQFIAQFCRVECLKKELGNVRLQPESALLTVLQEQMVNTLAEMTPDEDNEIELDNSFEEEMA